MSGLLHGRVQLRPCKAPLKYNLFNHFDHFGEKKEKEKEEEERVVLDRKNNVKVHVLINGCQ